jgi:hypothetical protein
MEIDSQKPKEWVGITKWTQLEIRFYLCSCSNILLTYFTYSVSPYYILPCLSLFSLHHPCRTMI